MIPHLIDDNIKLWPPAGCHYCGRLTIRTTGTVPCCWACDLEQGLRQSFDTMKETAMAKTTKRQATRDKVKAKTKAKAAEQITAKKSSRKNKRGR